MQGAPFTLVHIDLANKPEWYTQVNSRGLVPALEFEGGVRVESAELVAWVDTALPGPVAPLTPADAALRREMQQLCSGLCSALISTGLQLLAGSGRSWGAASGARPQQRSAFQAALAQLAAALERHGGPYLLGAQVTQADVLLYPFAWRFACTMPVFSDLDVRSAAGGAPGRWLAAMAARDSCAASSPDPQRFMRAVTEHASLDFFDYVSYAAWDLHPQHAGALMAQPPRG